MREVRCPNCDVRIDASVPQCPNCEIDIAQLRRYARTWNCPRCGTDADSGTCPECGFAVGDLRGRLLVDNAAEKDAETGEDIPSGDERRTSRPGSSTRGAQEGRDNTNDPERGNGERPTDPKPPIHGDRMGSTSTRPRELAPDEIYCTKCGAVVDRRVEACPACGRNPAPPADRPPGGQQVVVTPGNERYQRLAEKDQGLYVVMGLFLPPVAYLKLGMPGHAFVNLITLNFLLLGFLIVPIHVYDIIRNARRQVGTPQ